MSAAPNPQWTAEEYLVFERASDEKHEYIAGEVYLMTGASREHNLIVFNTVTTLGNQLKGKPCEAYANDMRVKINEKDYTYPDLVVVCAPPVFEDDHVDTLLNPMLIIEVLSPSTEQYDRSTKFEMYRELDSFREYLLIAQRRAHIEQYVFQEKGVWRYSEVKGLDGSINLPSIGCVLNLSDVYDKVAFE